MGGRPVGCNSDDDNGRNVVERGFNDAKQRRGSAPRYDKLAVTTAAASFSERSPSGCFGRTVCHDEWMSFPALVPELLVSDTLRSIEFWCGLCGFEIDYQRPEEGFACVSLGSAQIMLEQRGIGRNWITAPLEPPLGRGVNFQISVPTVDPIVTALRDANYSLFMPPETKWYRTGDLDEAGVRQFLVTDPDGYLIRFQASLGHRPVAP